MEYIPTEVLERILSYLQLETLEVAHRVCSRWAQLINRRHFQPFLASQDYNIVKSLEKEGWSGDVDDDSLIQSSYTKVRELERNWSGVSPRRRVESLGEYSVGDTSAKISCVTEFRDKLYLGRQDSQIEVFSLASLARMYMLESEESQENLEMPGVLSRGCNLVRSSCTLACTTSTRSKVLLYSLETDELVGAISNKLSHVYSLALTDRLLVCLSGWCLLSWRVDTNRPETVRGKFLGMFPDFQPTEEFQNWLEVHSAVINRFWLVTRATRLKNNGEGSVSFIHCRRIGPDGHLGPVLRPNDTMYPESVVEVTDLKLNDKDLLASLVVEQCPGRVAEAPMLLRHSVQITNLSSGDIIAALSSENLFTSVHVPVCWIEDWLYLKVVPTPFPDDLDIIDAEVDDSCVSLERWNLKSGLKEKNMHTKISSGNDHLILQQSRLTIISSKFSNSAEVEASYYNDEEFPEEVHPKFTSKVEILDFWKV